MRFACEAEFNSDTRFKLDSVTYKREFKLNSEKCSLSRQRSLRPSEIGMSLRMAEKKLHSPNVNGKSNKEAKTTTKNKTERIFSPNRSKCHTSENCQCAVIPFGVKHEWYNGVKDLIKFYFHDSE